MRNKLVVLPWLVVSACAPLPSAEPPAPAPVPAGEPTLSPSHAVVPRPLEVRFTGGEYRVDSTTTIYVDARANADVRRVAGFVSAMLAPVADTVVRALADGSAPPARSIYLSVAADPSLGNEGYALVTTADGIRVSAGTAQGLFYGVQTLRQLLPVSVEHRFALRRRLVVPAVEIRDRPRFEWRGSMLDVSRHFLPPADVKRYVDLMALHKLNRLHLHLSDDQGWRVEIRSWPNLARHGGSTQVGGGRGGYYTQEEFAGIVEYAAARFITVVPEFDMPGHTNAALASYGVLNCDDTPRPLYTGTRVGFSALCVERDTVYAFVRDVVREVGAIARGPWFHIGGDEVERLTPAQYRSFVERVERIVREEGKTMIGWGDIAPANLHPSTIVQHWIPDSAHVHVARGGRVIMSPARRAYLDMKYDSSTALGLMWAAIIEVRDAYSWDPATLRPGVPESAVLGVEAPLWSETVVKLEDFEYLAFPRLAALAEVAWSRDRSWDEFRIRLGAHGARLAALGVNFYRSPQIPWIP